VVNVAGQSEAQQANIEICDDYSSASQQWAFAPLEQKFDLGTASSPLASGYTQVTETTAYASGGFGWTSTAGNQSRDRSVSDPLQTDFVFNSAARTFRATVPNSTYNVKVTMGDANTWHDQMAIKANGAVVAPSITAGIDQWVDTIFQVTVTNGLLDLEFSDGGGSDANWVVNAIEIY
jgi:fibronectin type 3 domain-containing protein